MGKRLPNPLIILSAIFYVLCFPPHEVAVLGWIALVPWFIYLASFESKSPGRTAFFQGICLSVLISVGGFFWVAYVLHTFGGLPWPVASIGLFFFGLIGQPQFTLGGALIRRALRFSLKTDRMRALIALTWIALFFTTLDWLLPKLFRDTFGHHWVGHENLRMNARWAGAYGLTFLSTFSNLSIAYLFLSLRTRQEPSAWPAISRAMPTLLTAVALILGSVIYGNVTRRWIEERVDQAPQSARLAVIQANIGDIEKLSAEQGIRHARQSVMATFLKLSDQALATPASRPQAIVWPETAFPSSFRKPTVADELELDQMVENFAKTRQIPVLFGGYDEDLSPPRKDYNAFFFLGKNAGPDDLQVYRKNRLLLFGEELPFSDSFPQLRQWFPQVGNFGRGKGPQTFTLPTQPPIQAAPAICYEVLFPNDMVKAKRDGAEMILNITNDSWFGPYAQPQLHLGLSVFRPIELGIPMLRATNTGISAVIDPAGRILQKTEIGVPVVLDAKVPLMRLPPSPVERWGDFFPKVSMTLTLLLLGAPTLRKALLRPG